MQISWQKVYQDSSSHRAEIVKAFLEENDFDAMLVDKKDWAYQFGHYEVLVPQDHVIRAIKIINEEIHFE